MSELQLQELAQQLGTVLLQQQRMLTTAESCTGGWAAQAITSIAGSSQWFERGFVTYTNLAKQEMLGVTATTLEAHGAVSEATVSEMVTGALRHSHAGASLAISGIAGPSGGTPEKPVGMVCFAWALKGQENSVVTKTEYFHGDRQQVRKQAVITALQGMLYLLKPG